MALRLKKPLARCSWKNSTKPMPPRAKGRSASLATQLVLHACRMGLHRHTQDLLARVGGLIAGDPALDSLVTAMENLLVLEVSREPLEAHHLSGLHELATTAYHRACYVIPSLAITPPEDEAKMIEALNGLFQAVRSLGDNSILQQLRTDALLALAATSGGSATLRGAGVGLLYADGKLEATELVVHLHGHLHSSRDGGEDGPNFLRGLLKTARSSLWLVPEILVNLQAALHEWDDDRFVKLLPLLPVARFSQSPRRVKPIVRVAKSVAALLGAQSLDLTRLPDIDSGEMLRAVEVNRTVRTSRLWPMDWRCFVSERQKPSPLTPLPVGEGDLQRWRLVLGRFSEPRLGSCGKHGSRLSRMDRVLDYLYGREYRGRGVRGKNGGQDGQGGAPGDVESRMGGDADSVLSVPDWIHQVRELFPNDTSEIIQRHALDRYGMTELVTDAEVLKKMEPSYELLKAILAFKGMMSGEVLELARKIVREVVEDLRRKLAKDIRQALWGRLNKQRRSRLKVLRNLDWRRTVRDNLKNFDRKRKQIVLGSLHFFSRVDHHMRLGSISSWLSSIAAQF